jgi:stage III sporulation protein AG
MQTKNKSVSKIQNKKLLIIIILIVIGIILLIIPNSGGNSNQNNVNPDLRLEEYATRIEDKIADLCSSVRGVANVKVTVYFDSGFETVYAYNEESKTTSSGYNSEKKYVTVGSGNDESMVCLFEKMPNICGVAVVCNGGGNPVVANEIINMISSAFGVPKSKIYVTEGKN